MLDYLGEPSGIIGVLISEKVWQDSQHQSDAAQET